MIHTVNTSSTVEPDGYVILRAQFSSNQACDVSFYVVPDDVLVVLGLIDMTSLGIGIDIRHRLCLVASQSSTPSPDALLDSLEQEFPGLFAPGIGKVPNFQHRILLKDSASPKILKLRHPPFSMRDEVRKELDSLLAQGVIESTDKAEYVHPLHFIRKPDGSIRTTVDFSRGLNLDIIPSVHPLPLPSDIFSRVCEDKFFSKLDVSKAYFHLELAPESRPLTAFITPSHGLCQFKRVPMGLTDSGAAFQKRIELTLAGLPGVDVYIDDILVRGRTRAEHDSRLRSACARLEHDGFRLQRKKLLIAQTEVSFTGHLLVSSPTGTTVKPDPRNGAAIRSMSPPTDLHGLRQFLGSCNYYSQFIRDYAELTEPLHNLTRKDVTFVWTPICQVAFDSLKARISSPEVLVPFNPNLPTFLTTDASDVGLGAVLSQTQDGADRAIAFASKTLAPPERNYSTPERETLACVWAAEYFEKFLLGRHFTLRTDQSSLQTLLTRFGTNRTSRRISRWYDRIRHFDYNVIHIKGKLNVCADMLSRLSTVSDSGTLPTLEDDDDRVIVASLSLDHSVTTADFIAASSRDADLTMIRHFLLTQWPPRKQIPDGLRPYFRVRSELSVRDSCVYRGDTLVVPIALRSRILSLLHSGHPGINRMLQKLRDSYFWPRSSVMVEDFVRRCPPCSATGKSSRPDHVPVTAIPPPSRPWAKVAIDITGPFSTAPKHQRHIVVVTDYFSKYPEICLTNLITSRRIIDWLEELFARFGNPDEVVSDNGPQFSSHEFRDFLRAKNIRHNPVSVYTPMQNGLVEVFNRSLKQGAQIIHEEGTSFKSGLLDFLASFRSTAPEHGASPSELLFGWKLRSDSDIRNSSQGRVTQLLSLSERASIVTSKFNKRRYGLEHKVPRRPFTVGDMVRVKKPSNTFFKGQNPYSQLLEVVECRGRWNYKLSDGQVWNARRLIHNCPQATTWDEEDEESINIPPRQVPAPPRHQPVPLRRSTRWNFGIPPVRWITQM